MRAAEIGIRGGDVVVSGWSVQEGGSAVVVA
jgi:hypothetical protein